MKIVFLVYILSLIIFLIFFKKKNKIITSIDIVMGKTGVGKTTYLALQAKKYLKAGYKVFSNFSLKGAYKINPKADLGRYLIENAVIIIDEAGLEFNARDWKAFGKQLYHFFTLHRHYRTKIILAVQHWDRLDIVIRELVHRIYIVKPVSIFLKPWFIKVKEVGSRIGISEENQITQEFFYQPWFLLGVRYFRKRKAWDMFDTHSKDEMERKEFELWSEYVYVSFKDKLLNRLNAILTRLKSSILYIKKGLVIPFSSKLYHSLKCRRF